MPGLSTSISIMKDVVDSQDIKVTTNQTLEPAIAVATAHITSKGEVQ